MIDKKNIIIEKAIELFAEQGFEGTSIRELAAAADVNIAMINYYFGSKEKLFEAIVAERAGYNKDMLEELVANEKWSNIEKLDRIIENYVTFLFSTRRFQKVIHQEVMMHHRIHLHEDIVTMFSLNAKKIIGIIEKGIKQGEFRKVDTSLTYSSIFGTINHVLLSQRMCKKIFDMPKDGKYVPYEDETFKKRVIKHLKQLMHVHLLKQI